MLVVFTAKLVEISSWSSMLAIIKVIQVPLHCMKETAEQGACSTKARKLKSACFIPIFSLAASSFNADEITAVYTAQAGVVRAAHWEDGWVKVLVIRR